MRQVVADKQERDVKSARGLDERHVSDAAAFPGPGSILRGDSALLREHLELRDRGFYRLAVDEASLVNGFFTLRHCEGMMPDGLIFPAPLVDELPAGRQLAEHFFAARLSH